MLGRRDRSAFFVIPHQMLAPALPSNTPLGRRHRAGGRCAEHEGDTRGAVVALREARECLETLARMLPVEHSGVVEHVLTEREKLEAERSIKCLIAEDSDSKTPLLGVVASSMNALSDDWKAS